MKHIPAILIFLALASCSDNKTTKTSTPTSETRSQTDSSINCYRYASANDTISLELIKEGKSVSGILIYKLHEKDKNEGTIHGTLQGDILIADYTFRSEGAQSVRQVAFKRSGNYFIEGYGDITETNGKVSFKNIDALQYNDRFKLSEVDCE
jgi:hypothetical protein